MTEYIPTIGLEIHANVKTETKMFCSCTNDLTEREPNKNTCPICLAHPGTLPTANREAIRKVIRLGLAVGGTIAEHSHFDRKSYFYPDLPKGYQISQYEEPLVTGGELEGVRITRVHLEEDAGRLAHVARPNGERMGTNDERIFDKNSVQFDTHSSVGVSLVDFNRAGVPLLELVTEPDMHDGVHAVRFAKSLQRILKYLGVSDADMEEGQMRVEVNISLGKGLGSYEGAKKLTYGTKVEVKNLNSFRAVQGAIDYEIKRQGKLLEDGEIIVQETRGWNDEKGITESQRGKEDAHDYRYFPEPDLPPLNLAEWGIDELRAELPELPAAKRKRFVEEFAVTPDQADGLTDDRAFAEYFEAAASEFKERLSASADPSADKPGASYASLVNYLLSDLRGLMGQRKLLLADLKVSPEHFGHFASLVSSGKLSSRLAKNLLLKMAETGEDPETLIRKSGVEVVSDVVALEAVAKEIVAANPKPAADYRAGKLSTLQFFLGQGMAKTKGQADPAKLREAIEKTLSS
ncbi:MAG: Asp-tRNA(Asn)/Glu-tRNA(Gln) amidotransferase subunit GatB [bacterium]|nr:Asp-tRNA(Asn)/Glu-tRNA(Gln) amidotransferase subunit GatB [bacterium]